MAKREGVTEQLKENNQMEWVDQMNNIRSRAMKIIYKNTFLYDKSNQVITMSHGCFLNYLPLCMFKLDYILEF